MNEFYISQDKEQLDIPMIYEFLSQRSYWAKDRSYDEVITSIKNSLCFGVYLKRDKQVGFARVVTDGAIFGWIMDVFVLEEYRGLGFGKKLMSSIVNDTNLKHLKRMGLGTADAHGLYEQYGFKQLSQPQNMMERV